LAIPHLLALYALAIAASVVVVIGWFGALFTGRLPGFAANYLSGYVRWYCGVAAYLLLLTDEYPPLAFHDDAYPVRAEVNPGKLKRVTVLLRGILLIHAGVVSATLACGVGTIVIFIAWLIALIIGRLPTALHQALTAVLRYTVRYNGYAYLLTDSYPAGLFGDAAGLRAARRGVRRFQLRGTWVPVAAFGRLPGAGAGISRKGAKLATCPFGWR
jgi:hypothetical protein